jgi:hypothetical protein
MWSLVVTCRALDLAIAAAMAGTVLWTSMKCFPVLGQNLIVPAFALFVRVFPAGVHAGIGLDIATYGTTVVLLAGLLYGIIRTIICFVGR